MRLQNHALAISAASILLCLAMPVFAGPGDDPAKTGAEVKDLVVTAAKNKDIFTFDFGVPTSPAITLIGTTNEALVPSTALKPYVVQVPATYGGAKGAQSFALDFAPAWFLLGNDSSMAPADRNNYENYSDLETGHGQLLRLLDRTRLGAALYLGDDGGGDATKAKDSRLALGLSISFLDTSDPLATAYMPPTGAPVPAKPITVWEHCAEGVYAMVEGDYTVKYRALFAAKDEFVLARAPMDKLGLSGSPAQIDAASLPLKDCLAAGCGVYKDEADALRLVLAERNDSPTKLPHVRAALAVLEQKFTDDVDTKSIDIATKGKISTKFNDCTTIASNHALYGNKLDFGGGVVWDGKPGTPGDFAKASGAAWLAGRFALNPPSGDLLDKPDLDTKLLDYWLLGGSLRAGWHETVATGNSVTPKIDANVVNAWVGLESYSANYKLAALAGYKDTMAVDPAQKAFSNSGFRWQVSGSFKFFNALDGLVGDLLPDSAALKNGAWLNVSYGSAAGTVKTLDDKAILITLTFAPAGPDNLLGTGG